MIKDFYTKLQGNQRILFIAAFVCVVVAVMDRMVLGPILSQMKLMDVDINAKSQVIKRNVRIISFQNGIINEHSKYNEYFDNSKKTQEEITSSLLKEIELLAKQKTITISSISPGDVTDNRVYKEYNTNVECEGKLGDMLGFINLLSESNYLFQVKSYALTPKSKNAEVMKASIKLARVFISVEKSETKTPVKEKVDKEKNKVETKKENKETETE